MLKNNKHNSHVLICVILSIALSGDAGRPFYAQMLPLRHELKRSKLRLIAHQLPVGARITDLEINFVGRTVDSISRIPNGWTVQIENLPESASKLEAHARSSDASFKESDFNNIDIYMLMDQFSLSTRSVGARFTIITPENEKRIIPMSDYSFEFEDVFTRRRLPVARQ
jgi:hypothetical protein